MADNKEAMPPRPEHGIYTHVYNESKGYSHEVISWEGARAYAALAIAELRAEVERLRADADRLDWLARRDLNALCLGYNEDAPGPYTVNGSVGRTFREAIDAARAGASGGAE